MKNNSYAYLLVIVICFCLLSCSNPENKNTAPTTSSDPVGTEGDPAKLLFESKCTACHGSDGTAGLANAANLQTSKLDTASIIETITNGRGGMASFKNQLSEKEIHELADYVYSLRK